jgi:hypothetical protein
VSEWVRLIPQGQIDHGRVHTRKVLLIETSLADPQDARSPIIGRVAGQAFDSGRARDGTIGRVNPYVHVYAVLRHDLYLPTEEIRNQVTIVAVVPTAEEARAEVERLSQVNAEKRSEYFWLSARYYPEGREADSAKDPPD